MKNSLIVLAFLVVHGFTNAIEGVYDLDAIDPIF
jgi:hypothetical protein